MNTWKKLMLLRTNHDVIKPKDIEKVIKAYEWVDGCGVMSELEFQEQVPRYISQNVTDLWSKYEEAITNKIYEAQKVLDDNSRA